MVSPGLAEFDANRVHALSLDILTAMEDNEVPAGLGVVATAMTLGRLLNPNGYPEEAEYKFIEWVIQQSQLYFHEGVAN